MSLSAKIPEGPLAEKWSKHKRTLSLHRVVLTLLRITRMMATAFTVYFTIPLKVVTTVPVKLTFTV